MAKKFSELQEEAQQLNEIGGLKTAAKAVTGIGKMSLGLLKKLLSTNTGGGVQAVEGKKLANVETN